MEALMGKLDATIKEEIVRLARRELHKVSVPLKRDVRSLKITLSQLRKAVLPLERFAADQQKELAKRGIRLEVSPEELKKSRFSPRLIKTLRKKLGITQKELAILLGVTVGTAHQWEIGKFIPKPEKKAALAALRKLGRSEIKKLLQTKASEVAKAKK
jgi:DNA-binding transcriptional regulator YiaG